MNEVEIALWKIARVDIAELVNPQFETAATVLDWRNHVPVEVKELWGQLSLESRLCSYLIAQSEAENESAAMTIEKACNVRR